MSKVVLLVGAVEHRELALRTGLERGHRIVLVEEATSPLLPWAHLAVPVPDILDARGVRAGIDRAVRLARPDGILTLYDELFPLVAEVAADLGLPFVDPGAALRNANKIEQRTALEKAGVPIPEWATCTDLASAREAAARVGYPAILKAADQTGSGKIRIPGPGELAAGHARLAGARSADAPPLLVEELVHGQEYSVEAFVWHGRPTPICVTHKTTTGGEYPVELGHALPYRGRDVDAVVTAALDAVRAVGVDHTLVHVEVFRTLTGPRVVEVNARSGGDYIMDLVARCGGANPYDIVYDLSLGRAPSWHPTWRGAAAIRFLVADRAGRFAGITGVDAALALPGFHQVGVDRQSGTPVRRPRGGEDRLGWVVADGADWRQARDRAERIAAGLTPRIIHQLGPRISTELAAQAEPTDGTGVDDDWEAGI
ncbi:ATP-grasp domain-containing protein [Plantactinospora endophytica]|uniref:Argininosuccinate lyase n=1 Tax=Plantactinospora endophytica TaxID=673535 RepID=A0ABQ4E716_9ACTN|nr:ATP-grasp domain-containing protein [Plantactinospora endophytica]GIG90507.1 argininosuccinate lyase [Plantactinospora endophytica]